MITNIRILDNFISPNYSDYLASLVQNGEVPLQLITATLPVFPPNKDKLDYNEKDTLQFSHNFVNHKEICSNYWNVVEPIQFNFFAKTGNKVVGNLTRCILNVNVRDVSFLDEEHYPKHIDRSEPGITAIYYVNDADGDTLFFDETNNIIFSCTPKKGRLVYFNNQINHAGSPPKLNAYRAVINFNWVDTP